MIAKDDGFCYSDAHSGLHEPKTKYNHKDHEEPEEMLYKVLLELRGLRGIYYPISDCFKNHEWKPGNFQIHLTEEVHAKNTARRGLFL
jgi:hypothetical protein